MNISHLTPTFADIKTWVRSAAVSVNQLITGKQDKSDNLTSLAGLDLASHSGDVIAVVAGEDGFELVAQASGGSGISDGDYGDITVSGTGTVLTIDNDAVTYAKIQNVSATDKLLGRSTAGAGDVEEIACTAAGRAILDDATTSDQLTTLGLSANGKSLVTAADYAAMKALLDLEIGTDVQAYGADLTAIEALSGTNTIYYRSAANTWTAVTISNDLLFSGGTLGRNKGTSFPGSPASGDRFTRTDRNIDYFYDGTRWLSTQLHTVHLPPSDALTPATATTSLRNGRAVPPFYNLYDVYLVDAIYWYVLVGTGDWTTVLSDQGGGTLATLANVTSTSNVAGRTSLNLVRTATQTSYYYYTTTENSGTAQFYTNWAITYRLIG